MGAFCQVRVFQGRFWDLLPPKDATFKREARQTSANSGLDGIHASLFAPLTALLLPVSSSEALDWTAAHTKRLGMASDCFGIDLLFHPVAYQIAQVKEAMGDDTLQPGDYFCTRHSSDCGLFNFQLVIHFITSERNIDSSPGPTDSELLGLSRLFTMCSQNDIRALTLPVLLTPPNTVVEGQLNHSQIHQRAFGLLRCIVQKLFAAFTNPSAVKPLHSQTRANASSSLSEINILVPATHTRVINHPHAATVPLLTAVIKYLQEYFPHI
eukprot:Filipodium_phascolosomae@DN3694_c0_g1_i1.p1